MANFRDAHKITAAHEGGYANHIADTGGETYKGIARKHWPHWPGWGSIDAIKLKVGGAAANINASAAVDLTLQKHVESFYKKEFWDKNKLDAFTSQAVATEVYDTGVNMGTAVAAKFLQEAMVLLGENIAIDGAIGPVTIAKVNAYPSPTRLVKLLNLLQGQKYLAIVRNNPTQKVFLNGWLNRV
ncbi:glycoside hydrolase family 108 protein [Nibribacter koreensis]|uniref:Glycosyl hydrolase 108 family protein n=1 Tax=Nibribacter koreensis TaxID=1084519 RepID=A0ABP8FAX8_9BACT